MMATVFDAIAAGRVRLRRARNLRTVTRAPAPSAAPRRRSWGLPHALPRITPAILLAAGCVLLALLGAATIAAHARWLAAAAGPDVDEGSGMSRPAALQPVLPGAAFDVPEDAGVHLARHGGAALLVLAGMRAEPARRVDLCTQLANPGAAGSRGGAIVPLQAGLRFADVPGLVARGVPLRNAMLTDAPMPHVTIAGDASLSPSGAGLSLRWTGAARWVGDGGVTDTADGGRAVMGRQGWLLWGAHGALRIVHRPGGACPRAGELVFQLYRPAAPDAAGRALAVAFPAGGGAAVETRLAPGSYRVPAAAPAAREDERLFAGLRARGLVRMGADGLAELAPPDLFAWRAGAPAAGSPATRWDGVTLDDETRRLLEHLYRRADGEFVREQVRIFNGERRLLAWRLATEDAADTGWRAEVAGAPVPLTATMPAGAARLFERLPEGWSAWRRVASWPAASTTTGATARLRLALPASSKERAGLRLMLAGRFIGVQGAHLAQPPRAACLGRGCARADDVQVLDLVPEGGAREVVLDAAPLPADVLATPGDARYRHLAPRGGQLVWQALPAPGARTTSARADVVLADRAGRPLWHDGAPSAAARAAGLATLLGVNGEQAGGVAGMLARLPANGRHEARLTLDLALQGAAQAALECIGMRRGRWDGAVCHGGAAAPEGRQAGLVVLDAETGAILASAGAGTGNVDAAGWAEARDFDRIDPARSPLRLTAWQHDGGAERSPGSTFKIVSALGLEAAAQADPRLDGVLDGLPLGSINALAARAGYAFRTDAPDYPLGARAHITNFRDQGLDRRAEDGRLGLAQALTYSLNTWFAWTGELADRSLFRRPEGGAPDLQPLAPGALDEARPVVAMARRLGFGTSFKLDGGLLPADFPWAPWDALQATAADIDPIHTRHELRQMTIGLRMQATPLQMALVAAGVGQGRVVTPHLLARLDGRDAVPASGPALGVRLDRVRAGLKGVVDSGTAAGAFRGADLAAVRRGLSGKTGTAPLADGDRATVWFTGWLEPHTLPGQAHRLALAVFVSRSEATGGEHAAPVVAAVLRALAQTGAQSPELQAK